MAIMGVSIGLNVWRMVVTDAATICPSVTVYGLLRTAGGRLASSVRPVAETRAIPNTASAGITNPRNLFLSIFDLLAP
jgi:hypothetical protein